MKPTLLIAAIAAGLTLAATAEARGTHGDRGQHMQMPAFEDLDANADGAVTMAEIEAAMQARADEKFAQMDTDGDGALSAAEMVAGAETERQERMERRIADRIEKADTNGDGVLQAEELAEARGDQGRRGRSPERMFERMDQDDNGSLSAEEFADAQERMGERGRRHGGDRHDNN